MTPRTGIWLIVKPLIQYKPLFLLFQAVQTSIFYKLILLTERGLGLRKMRCVAHVENSHSDCLHTRSGWKTIPGVFFFFEGGSRRGCDLVDRNKMQDMSKYLQLEAEWELSVTQLRQRGLGKRSVLPGLEQELEPAFTPPQANTLIGRLLTTVGSTLTTISNLARDSQLPPEWPANSLSECLSWLGHLPQRLPTHSVLRPCVLPHAHPLFHDLGWKKSVVGSFFLFKEFFFESWAYIASQQRCRCWRHRVRVLLGGRDRHISNRQKVRN